MTEALGTGIGHNRQGLDSIYKGWPVYRRAAQEVKMPSFGGMMTSSANELSVVLGGIIKTAIALTEADFGDLQRLDPDGLLRIVAHSGFPDWWIDYWNTVASGNGTCGMSLAQKERVVVEDVEQSPIFAGTPGLDVQRRAGIRAVQSTPLIGSTGQVLGILSTHYRATYRPDLKTQGLLDLLAAHAATIIECEAVATAFRKSEERFRLAMDTAEEGIWEWRLATGEVYYSPGFSRMLGYAPAEIDCYIGSLVSLLHPEEAGAVIAEVTQRLVEPGHYSLEFRVRRKDGSYCWVRSRGRAVEHDDDGKPARAVGTYVDVTASKRAEDALRASEERLRLFIEHAPVALAMLDREMRYLAASRRWLHDFSLEEGEIVGCSHYEIFPEIDEALKAVHRRALGGETVSSEDDRFVRADGTIQWLRWEVQPWRTAGGEVGGILIFSEDITARKIAEMAMRESESRLQRAQQAAKVGTWEWDVVTGRNHWSDETFRLYGLEPGVQTPGYESWIANICPEDREVALATIKRCVARGEEFELEWRTINRGGQLRWLLSRGQPEFDGEGRLLRYQGIVMDVTERKRVTQALEEARSILAEAQKIAHFGSFEYNVAEASLYCSDEQYRIHGLDPGAPPPTLDESLSRFIFPEDAELLRRDFLEAPAGHRDFDQEYRIIRQDGSVRWVHTLAHPYYDEQGNFTRYVGTTMDITERKRETSEAKEHGELLQALVRQQVAVQTATAFAHELNQPLVSIAAYNEVALRAAKGGKAKAETLARAIQGSHEQALRAGQVLRELIEQLHKGEVEPKPFDINALIEEVVTKLRKTEFRSFRVSLDLGRELPLVCGNRLQTEKVLLNLIQNGIDAMEQAGVTSPFFCIAVRTLAGRKMAHVTVRDSGPGLDAETSSRVFEPFFSTKRNGLGLGLPISRSLIEAQDGQLWVDPEDGPGAVFHFTLPYVHE